MRQRADMDCFVAPLEEEVVVRSRAEPKKKSRFQRFMKSASKLVRGGKKKQPTVEDDMLQALMQRKNLFREETVEIRELFEQAAMEIRKQRGETEEPEEVPSVEECDLFLRELQNAVEQKVGDKLSTFRIFDGEGSRLSMSIRASVQALRSNRQETAKLARSNERRALPPVIHEDDEESYESEDEDSVNGSEGENDGDNDEDIIRNPWGKKEGTVSAQEQFQKEMKDAAQDRYIGYLRDRKIPPAPHS